MAVCGLMLTSCDNPAEQKEEVFALSVKTNTVASGHSSHASGYGTRATATAQTVVGKNNKENNDALFIVGNGSSSADANRKNAFEVLLNGNIKIGNTTLSEAQLQKILRLIDTIEE